MSQKLVQVLPPPLFTYNNSDNPLVEILRNILNKNTQEEVVKSLDKYYPEAIKPFIDIKISQIGDINNYTYENFEELIENDYKAFEKIKDSEFVKDKSIDIKEKFSEIIDNIFDYENVMVGIYIQKTKKFEEQINAIDLNYLQKNVIISILMVISISALLSNNEYDKIYLFLNIALKYSEILQSFADTLDVLTSK
jgi:hypothetical protein